MALLHHGVRSYGYIVTKMNVTEKLCSRTDVTIVTDGRSAAFVPAYTGSRMQSAAAANFGLRVHNYRTPVRYAEPWAKDVYWNGETKLYAVSPKYKLTNSENWPINPVTFIGKVLHFAQMYLPMKYRIFEPMDPSPATHPMGAHVLRYIVSKVLFISYQHLPLTLYRLFTEFLACSLLVANPSSKSKRSISQMSAHSKHWHQAAMRSI